MSSIRQPEQLVVLLPGGSSPYVAPGKKLYRWVDDELTRRHAHMCMLDYVGMGHYPAIGQGLSAASIGPVIAQKLNVLEVPYILLSSCFGTLVAAWLRANAPDSFHHCSKLIFWASPSNGFLRDLALKNQHVADFNNKTTHEKGFKLAEAFWTQTDTLLDLAPRFSQALPTLLMCGDDDEQCNAAYLHSCREAMSTEVSMEVSVVSVPAHHALSSAESPEEVFQKILE